MFNVQCSMFNVQCLMFNVQCSMFNVLSSPFSRPSCSRQWLSFHCRQQSVGRTFFFLREHFRWCRLSVVIFRAHDAQHFLIRSPYGFTTYSYAPAPPLFRVRDPFSAPSGEFLRSVLRISPLRPENFSAWLSFVLFFFIFALDKIICDNLCSIRGNSCL